MDVIEQLIQLKTIRKRQIADIDRQLDDDVTAAENDNLTATIEDASVRITELLDEIFGL